MQNNENTSEYYKIYFDLCSEEYYLNEQKCLSSHVWGLWVEGMKFETKNIKLQTAWKLYAQNYNNGFYHFFNDLIRNNNNPQHTIEK